MNIPEVAIGAIIAAAITGFISLLGLIIAKEQKISEFRQQWIKEFRHEVSCFVAKFGALVDRYDQIVEKETAKGIKKETIFEDKELFYNLMLPVNDEIRDCEIIFYKIKLYLAPKNEHDTLRELLSRVDLLFSDPQQLSGPTFVPLLEQIIEETEKVLKIEWQAVKKGEPYFRWAKYITSFVLIISLMVSIAHFISIYKADLQ